MMDSASHLHDDDCLFCKIIRDKDNATLIAELPHSVALLNFDQTNYPGRSLVVLKDHYTEYLALPKSLRDAFNDDKVSVARAIQTAFNPDRLNYDNLGNEVSHQHWHVTPRYKGGPNEGRPPWPVAEFKKLSDDEYRVIAQRIRAALPVRDPA